MTNTPGIDLTEETIFTWSIEKDHLYLVDREMVS